MSGQSAGKYLKPYQGLKLHHFAKAGMDSGAGKYLKPYQGLKPIPLQIVQPILHKAGKYLKPYQGLKL